MLSSTVRCQVEPGHALRNADRQLTVSWSARRRVRAEEGYFQSLAQQHSFPMSRGTISFYASVEWKSTALQTLQAQELQQSEAPEIPWAEDVHHTPTTRSALWQQSHTPKPARNCPEHVLDMDRRVAAKMFTVPCREYDLGRREHHVTKYTPPCAQYRMWPHSRTHPSNPPNTCMHGVM